MFILWALAAASVLVFLGYLAMLGTYQPSIPQGMSKFGKILAVILFIIAGLLVIFSLTQNLFRRNPMMGRPAFNYAPMMQRQQGMNPYGNMQNRPNFVGNQPGQPGAPVVMPNQGAGAPKRVQMGNRKNK